MPLEVAKEAITREFSNSSEFDEIEIDLFGGEPTLCKEMIIELVAWVEQQQFPKPALFFLETNGTLVHGGFQQWLLQHPWVNVGLSLDGTRETHDANRSNSYDRIDIPFFTAHYPEQAVRMTISGHTAKRLCEDVVHLHRLGFKKIDATFACGVAWNDPELLDMLEHELFALCSYYLDNPSVKECPLFEMHLPDILHRGATLPKRCGTGVEMVSIATSGRQYPCHTFQPNSTARPVESGRIDFARIRDFADPECAGCAIELACPTCYGINHARNGNLLQRDKQYCSVMKLRALAVSYLRGKQIEAGTAKMSAAEIHQTIRAIRLVQTSLLKQRTETPYHENTGTN